MISCVIRLDKCGCPVHHQKMRLLLYILSFLFFGLQFIQSQAHATSVLTVCTSSKEFITAYEFLKDQKSFNLPSEEQQRIAEKVSLGCSGAAARFIRVSHLLLKVEMPTKQALEVGLKYSTLTDAATDAFILVFQKSYLSEYLDLDLSTAVKLAQDYSIDVKGDLKTVQNDFLKLTDFCVREKNLDLPKPTCAEFVKRVTLKGQPFEYSTSEVFLQAFQFTTNEKTGPQLTTRDALKLSEDLVSFGPLAAENFISSYLYAARSDGLALSREQSLAFAKKIAESSKK